MITYFFLFVLAIPGFTEQTYSPRKHNARAESKRKNISKGGNHITQITFERSGGLVAAPGMTIKATVDLKQDGTAEVRAESSDYSRELSPEEARDLREMVGITGFFQLQPDLRNRGVARQSSADQYQYDITVQTQEGKRHTVTLDEGSVAELNKLAPGLDRLVAWIRKEANAIWKQKISQTPRR